MKALILTCLTMGVLVAEEVYVRPPEKEITPQVQPHVKNCVAEPFVFADFIYWKVWQGGMAYASTGFGDQNNLITDRGRIFEPDFQGEPGFRIGVGVNLAHDGWDLLLQYTWIHSGIEDRVSRDINDEQVQLLWPFAPVNFFSGFHAARADWDIHMNVLDLEWGRSYYVSRFSTLRPFFGLKGLRSDQDYKVRYWSTDSVETMDATMDVWGFGIRVGLDTAWYFAQNWAFYGDMALSAAWTRFDSKRKDHVDEAVVLNSRYKQYGMTPILELQAGLRWEMWFSDDNYHTAIQVGWEEQVWWDFNRLIDLASRGPLGNLDFQGLTLRFRFDF